jgi:hypothetical protein
MKLSRKHIITIASCLIIFLMIASYRLFWYLLKHHTQKVDADYFLIACVVCGTMPLIIGLLYGVYRYLERLKEKQQAEDDEKFLSDYIEGRK